MYWEIKEVVYSLLDLFAKYSFAAVLLWARARDVVPRTCQVLIERMLGVLEGAEREVARRPHRKRRDKERDKDGGKQRARARTTGKQRDKHAERERRELRGDGHSGAQRGPSA